MSTDILASTEPVDSSSDFYVPAAGALSLFDGQDEEEGQEITDSPDTDSEAAVLSGHVNAEGAATNGDDCKASLSETAVADTSTSAEIPTEQKSLPADAVVTEGQISGRSTSETDGKATPSSPAISDPREEGGAGQPGESFEKKIEKWFVRYATITEKITTVLIELNAAKERAKHLGKLLKELGEEAAMVKSKRPDEVGSLEDSERNASCVTKNKPAAAALADDLSSTDPNAWRSIPIEQLKLKASMEAKLLEAGISSIGQLKDLRAGAGLKSVKGIGQAKADQIEEAVINWLSKNRDAGIFSGAPPTMTTAEADSSAETEPPDDDQPTESGQEGPSSTAASVISSALPSSIAANDPDAARAAAVEKRSQVLLAEHFAAVDCGDKAEALNPSLPDSRYWNSGVEAFDKNWPVRDCPYDPVESSEAGDWIRGWLTARADDEQRRQPVGQATVTEESEVA